MNAENSFLKTLPIIEDGSLLARADRVLRDVVTQARATGKKGSLAVVLTIEPRGANTVLVHGEVRDKTPEEERIKSIFFVGEAGDLVRENPDQEQLPFRAEAGR